MTTQDPPRREPKKRIVVKLRANSAARNATGALEIEGLRFRPLLERVRAQVDGLAARAAAIDPAFDASGLGAYWTAECPTGVDPKSIVRTIERSPDVELAYVQGPPPQPPSVGPSDDPEFVKQTYAGQAPVGIDAQYAWLQDGGDGAGVVIVDMEQGWELGHVDLPSGIPLTGHNHSYFDHGTAVLGQLVAVDNTIGCVGLAPGATARVTSQWFGPGPSDYYLDSEVIVAAVASLSFGDVLLLEAGSYVDPDDANSPVGPCELDPATFDAIQLATALGIIVVEAGHNSGIDLDLHDDPLRGHFLNRASTEFRDSGAIMVGAATATVPHVPFPWSSHGSRIDCYGWGDTVTTTGPGTTGYRDDFSGTSSASPIVAAAAILVQSMAEASLGYRFSPQQMRAILADPANGTPSINGAADRIGVMPDLKKIVTSVLTLVPDVYMRDFVGDTGDPHNGPVAMSPDVIVQPFSEPDPQTAFGPGSNTENVDTLGGQVEDEHDNYVYVRVRNRGGLPAANVVADVYWSPPATLVTPNLWTPIGTAVLPSVPTGDQLTVSPEIVWPELSVPGLGHYCFVALIGTLKDPAPERAELEDWNNFTRFIRDHNNVTWRNFDVVNNESKTGFVELPFLITGPLDRPRRMELIFDFRRPRKAEVVLSAPHALSIPLRPLLSYTLKEGRPVLTLNPHARQHVACWEFPARMAVPTRLLVKIPKEARANDYTVAVRQLHQGEEIGRITWRLTPRAKPVTPRVSLEDFLGRRQPATALAGR